MKKNKRIFNYINFIMLIFIIYIGLSVSLSENSKLFHTEIIVCVCSFFMMISACIFYSYIPNKSKVKNIFKIYKYSKGYKLDMLLLFLYEVSIIFSSYSLYKLKPEWGIIKIIGIFIFLNYIFLFLKSMMEETFYLTSWYDRRMQLIRLRKYLDNDIENLNLKIVLFEDKNNIIEDYFSVNSLDLEVEINVKDIIYLSITNDIPKLKELYPEVEEKLKDYIYVYVNTVSKNENDDYIYQFKNKYEANYSELKTIEVLIFEELKDYKKPKNLEYIDFLKIYDKNEYISRIYDLLENDFVNTNKEFFVIENVKPSEGYNLYKNAYISESEYQEILILFNYMIYTLQIVTYYIYVKHSKEDSKKINIEILADNYDTLGKTLLKNINSNDYLYKKIKKKLFVSNDVQEILIDKIQPMLEINFKQEIPKIKISFAGLCDLLTLLRNKIQSHGSINEENVEEIAVLIRNLVAYFNYFLDMENFEIKNNGKEVYIRYGDEEFYSLGNYVIYLDDTINVVQKKSKTGNKYRYTNYFVGKHMRPQDVEI